MYRVSYAVFTFPRPVGVIPAFGTCQLPVRFYPREAGAYSQHWEIKSKADSCSLAPDCSPQVMRVELIAKVEF